MVYCLHKPLQKLFSGKKGLYPEAMTVIVPARKVSPWFRAVFVTVIVNELIAQMICKKLDFIFQVDMIASHRVST